MELNLTFLVELFTFLLVIFLLNKVLYGPITKALADRAEKIRAGLEAAEKSQKDAEAARKHYDETLTAAKREAQEILSKAAKQAEITAEEIVNKAKAESDKLLELAKANIEIEWEKARGALRREAVELAMLAATKAVESTLVDQAKQRAAVEEFLGGLNAKDLRH